MPRINVSLGDTQKSRWDDHVDNDPTVDGLSDLVRTAVEEYIADENSTGGELNDAVGDELMASLDQLDGKLADIDQGIDRLHRRQLDISEIEAIVDMQTDNIPDMFTLDLILRNALADIEDVEAGELTKSIDDWEEFAEQINEAQAHRREELNR